MNPQRRSKCVCVCAHYVMHLVQVLLCRVLSVPKLRSAGKRYRVHHMWFASKQDHENTHTHTHRSGRESASEQERQNILFLLCNQWLCKHTHTHTQGCLLSEAFPRCRGTKLHTRMGGCREGGMDGSTERWRVSLQQLRLTAGINTSLSGGLYLG